MLIEALDLAVQADVRLGLLMPRATIALAALPRGNQVAASAVVIRRGLTVQQTERMVAEVLEHPRTRARRGSRSGWSRRRPRPHFGRRACPAVTQTG